MPRIVTNHHLLFFSHKINYTQNKQQQHSQDIVCPEAVKVDDLDSAIVQKNYEAAKSAVASAEAGSMESAEATIELEVNRAMGNALGLSLA